MGQGAAGAAVRRSEAAGRGIAGRVQVRNDGAIDVVHPAVAVGQKATGASDGVFTNAAGMPTYAISGLAVDFDDVRAHGRDERLRVSSFFGGLDFYQRFLKALTSPQ